MAIRASSAVPAVAAAAATAAIGYAAGIERHRFRLRHVTLPVLDPDRTEGRSLRVLHISDLHMMPGQYGKQRWVAGLAALEPDLVVNTGDNLAHPKAVPSVLRALGGLLDRPGLFVFGSNDYYRPRPKNPLKYFTPNHKRVLGADLPWADLRAALVERGWTDMRHSRHTLEVAGVRVAAAGVDDPHLRRDDYARLGGGSDPAAELRLALTHSPEPRVLDAFAADGYDVAFAGHTHGGQLRVPGFGALVTNCGLDRTRARGVSRWEPTMWLHVSAGLGTSPYAPVRFACPPEASLLTLVPRTARGKSATSDRPGSDRTTISGVAADVR